MLPLPKLSQLNGIQQEDEEEEEEEEEGKNGDAENVLCAKYLATSIV